MPQFSDLPNRPLESYRRPALQFSGGKDSLACLYLLRNVLDRVSVYWLDTGDALPETLEIVAHARVMAPRFFTVRSDVVAWRKINGDPTDLFPAGSHWIGLAYGMGQLKLTSRFDCCFCNIMAPLNMQMIADGVDLVIRGTKVADAQTLPSTGQGDPYDIWLPIRHWSHDDVFAYLDSVGAPSNPVYRECKGMSAPECLGCTAWWDDGKAGYLRARHPDLLAGYQAKLSAISDAIASHLNDLRRELAG